MNAPHATIKRRDSSLDLFKTILICLMIWAHTIQLLDNINLSAAELFLSRLANLICFSGFVMAFGMGFAHSLNNTRSKNETALQVWKQPLTLYLAYLVCGVTYLTLVDNRPLSWGWGRWMVPMTILYAYTEFLATFVFFSLLTKPLRSLFTKVVIAPVFLFLSTFVALYLSFFPPSSPLVPILPVLIGYHKGAVFPLVYYMPWFLLGFWYVRLKLTPNVAVAVACFMASLPCAFFLYVEGELPRRDPPQAIWLMAAAFPLYLLFLLTSWAAKSDKMPAFMLAPGRQPLFFYVASSLVLFFLTYLFGQQNHAFLTNTLIAIALLSGLYGLTVAVEKLKRKAIRLTGPTY
ncbi:MAG: hypothetical protein PHW63_04765 [Alphaproteobacteria bacterium]|nr:hypothetical protein [Alphaproteobacteria bacterium]